MKRRRQSDPRAAWLAAAAELAAAHRALRVAPAGIARQAPYAQVLVARRRCALVVHAWLAAVVHIAPVENPVQVVVIGDGVLFDEGGQLPAVSLAGAIAMRVLQLAGAGVVVVTDASIVLVQDLVDQFAPAAAIAESAIPLRPGERVADRVAATVSSRTAEQLDRLRSTLRADPDIVLDPERTCSLRASRVVDGAAQPVRGAQARALLERLRLSDLGFRVTPRHTDFAARDASPLDAVHDVLSGPSLIGLPVAAVATSHGDAAIPAHAGPLFVPVGAPPGHRTAPGRQVISAGYEADDALWAAVWHLVPSAGLRQQAAEMLAAITTPNWFPAALGRRPALDARHAGHQWLPAVQQRTPTPTG